MDHAHRNGAVLGKLRCKEKTNRGKAIDARGVGFGPACFDSVGRFVSAFNRNTEETDVFERPFGGGFFRGLCLKGAAHRLRHIGLSGSNPDLSDVNIRKGDAFFTGDHFQLRGFAPGDERREYRHPALVLIGFCGDFLPGKFHGNGNTSFCFAPDGNGQILLQDGIFAKERMQLERASREEQRRA